jgi:hypothetical protein
VIPTAWAKGPESGRLGVQVKRDGTGTERVAARTHAVWPQRLSGARGCVLPHTGGARGSVSLRLRPKGVLVRWMTAGLCALSLVGILGCPHAFGRGGTIDSAVHQDVREGLDDDDGCTPQEYEENCVPDPNSEQCRKVCG